MSECIAFACLVTFSMAFPNASHGDSWPGPGARMFASEDGRTALKVIAQKDYRTKKNPAAIGVLFGMEGDGSEHIIWKQELVNIPMHALILRSYGVLGVVTLDTYANMGYEHSLVIYDKNGKLVKDFQLEDLLSKEEIAHRTQRSVSSRYWRREATFDRIHDPKNPKLRITFDWGKVLLIELLTGKIVPPEQQEDGDKAKTEQTSGE